MTEGARGISVLFGQLFPPEEEETWQEENMENVQKNNRNITSASPVGGIADDHKR